MSNVSLKRIEARSKGPEYVGPYAIYGEIGSGGMASVHLGKLRSALGFSRTVAIKRMHSDIARSPDFVAMFLQEVRLVGRIQHPNVVAALDFVAIENDAMLVMEYVHGLSLNQLVRKAIAIPPPVASAILVGAALGLHAAHEAVDESGKNLGIVHRDVSPHNVLVGVDGLARVLDFGIAKAAECVHHTRTGEVKGKVAYMAPEQLLGDPIGREADVYSLGIVMWELMTGRRLFANQGHGAMLLRVANSRIDSPRTVNPRITPEVEQVVMKALSRSPQSRYRTALDFAAAIEGCIPPASQRMVGEWVASVAKEELTHRSHMRTQMDVSATGVTLEPADDREVTSRFGLPPDAQVPAFSQVGVIRRRPPSMLTIGAAVVCAAALGATGAAYWPRAEPAPPARRAVTVETSILGAHEPAMSAAAVQAEPPAPTASSAVSTSAPPSNPANVGARDGQDPEPTASRSASPALWRPHNPRLKGSVLQAAVPAARTVSPTPASASDLGAIGGRE
ncbi:MAG: protein kinase [Polyangiaceae bacterium]